MSYFPTNTVKHTLLSIMMVLGLLATVPEASAYPLSYYKSSSALRSGHWVKVHVSGEGIFQVSYDQLREWGFQDPSKVAVFGFSPLVDTKGNFTSTHIDDLPPAAFMHTDDSRILFYGESDARVLMKSALTYEIERNYYDRKGTYFLTDAVDAPEMNTTTYRASTSKAYKNHFNLQLVEKEVNNIGEGGVFFHGPRLAPGESDVFTFHIKDFSSDKSLKDNGDVYIKYEYAQNSSVRSRLSTSISDNATVSSTSNLDCNKLENGAYLYMTSNGSMRIKPKSGVVDSFKDETVDFTVTNPASSVASYTAVDHAVCIYARESHLGDDAQLLMQYYYSSASGQVVEVRDTPIGTLAWNVEDAFNPFSYGIRRLDDTEEGLMRFTLTRAYNSKTDPARIVVFNPAATHQEVEFGGNVVNSDIHGMETPEMVIITTEELRPAAQNLADIHYEHQGLLVAVLTQEEIFNEFSSGVRTPMAYRRMAKMFYDRDPDVFKYILLYGPGTWDNRGIIVDNGSTEQLLTFQAEIFDHARDSHYNYANDVVFGMLDDSYDPTNIHMEYSQISVGRINVSNLGTAKNVNSKIELYLTNGPSATNYYRALLTSDRPDSLAHIKQSEESAELLSANIPGLSVYRAHTLLYPLTGGRAVEAHDALMRAFNYGMGFFSYCGHGIPDGLSYDIKLLTIGQINSETYETPSFGYFSTCDLFPFDRSTSLMDAMLASPTGGIIGGIGACRSVYLKYNQYYYLATCEAYSTALPGTTYSDLARIARNKMIKDVIPTVQYASDRKAIAVNTLAYNFCGDPAIMIPVPQYRIVLDEVNGRTFNASETTNYTPLAKNTIRGHVVNSKGQKMTAFNGIGLLELFEGPLTVNTYKFESQPTCEITLDETLLASQEIKIENGTFSLDFTMPEPQRGGTSNRMVLTAKDPTTGNMAAFADLLSCVAPLADTEAEQLPDTAPVIAEFYIDSPEFRNGDIVAPSFSLYAEIEAPECGVNFAVASLGSNIKLSYDVSTDYPGMSNYTSQMDNGRILIKKDFKGMPDGRHEFELSVPNVYGTRATAKLQFCVQSSNIEANLTLRSDGSDTYSTSGTPAARQSIDFDLIHSLSTTPSSTIIVADAHGNTVFRKENVSLPYTWNLSDNDGRRVADGHYNAWMMLNNGESFGSTPRSSFVVIE